VRRPFGSLRPLNAICDALDAASARSRGEGHEHPDLLDAARHHLAAERRQRERVVLADIAINPAAHADSIHCSISRGAH
jgi:hypothetical protein